MDSPSLTYTPRPDATPEAELTAPAAIYTLVLPIHVQREEVQKT